MLDHLELAHGWYRLQRYERCFLLTTELAHAASMFISLWQHVGSSVYAASMNMLPLKATLSMTSWQHGLSRIAVLIACIASNRL